MEEVWKDVEGYEGFYEVSSEGSVRRVGKPLRKMNANSSGYYVLSLCKEGKCRSHSVHTLVAIAFKNFTPDGTQRLVVDHDDGNKLNNKADNLVIRTNRENVVKGRRTGNTSLKIGVSLHQCGKWISHISIHGRKSLHLGLFGTEEAASVAYQTALNTFKRDEDYYRKKISPLSPKNRREYLLNLIS